MRRRDNKKANREIISALALILQIGLAMLVCMGMSFGIGYYLDRLFGTRFIMLIFLVIGFLASIRSMLVLTGKYHPGEMTDRKKAKKEESGEPDSEHDD